MPIVGVSKAQVNALPSNAMNSTRSNTCNISATFSFPMDPDFFV
jgi:hypothetical protein